MTNARLAMAGTHLGDPVTADPRSSRLRGDGPLHQVLGSDSHGLASAEVDAYRLTWGPVASLLTPRTTRGPGRAGAALNRGRAPPTDPC